MHPITYSLILNLTSLLLIAGLGAYMGYEGTPLLMILAVMIQTHALQRFTQGGDGDDEPGDDDEPAMGFLADVDKK